MLSSKYHKNIHLNLQARKTFGNQTNEIDSKAAWITTWENIGLKSTGRISEASGEGFNTKVVILWRFKAKIDRL